MSKNSQQSSYKRNLFTIIGDFFYDLKIALFPKVRKRGARSYNREAMIFVVALLAIPLIHFAIFWGYVNIQTIFMAFEPPSTISSTALANMSWAEKTFYTYKKIWLDNFAPLFSGKEMATAPVLPIAFRNTFIWFGMNIFVIMPLCLFIAFFIFKKILGYKIFRIVFYLPAVIPSIVLTYAYKEITSSTGPLSSILNIPKGGLLGNNATALPTALVYSLLCGFTTNMLLFSSGMARIPTEVLEAAKLDGVGPFKEITSLIIPLIWPTFTTQFILAFTGIFSAGGPILLLTQGQHETTTFAFWMFTQIRGMTGMDVGSPDDIRKVSAMGLVCTIIAVPIVFFTRWLCSKVDTIEY